MLTTLLTLALASTAFSSSPTSWMDPQAFHLDLGMTKQRVVERLKSDGLTTEAGKEPNHLIVQYDDGKTITLAFRRNRLESARFELVGFIPTVKEAFAEQQKLLARKRGEPTRSIAKPTLLTWEDKRPHITLVMSTARETSFGQQGLGFLVVRYFVPPPR